MARNNGKPKLLPPILKRIKKQSVTLIDSSENEEMSDDQDMITAKADNRNHCGKFFETIVVSVAQVPVPIQLIIHLIILPMNQLLINAVPR